jgi:hypothetical protein
MLIGKYGCIHLMRVCVCMYVLVKRIRCVYMHISMYVYVFPIYRANWTVDTRFDCSCVCVFMYTDVYAYCG